MAAHNQLNNKKDISRAAHILYHPICHSERSEESLTTEKRKLKN